MGLRLGMNMALIGSLAYFKYKLELKNHSSLRFTSEEWLLFYSTISLKDLSPTFTRYKPGAGFDDKDTEP